MLEKFIIDKIEETKQEKNKLGTSDKDKAIKLIYRGQLEAYLETIRYILIDKLDINKLSDKEYKRAVKDITLKYM